MSEAVATIAYVSPWCHREDGTVDYFCPRRAEVVRRQTTVPADALALMADDEAQRVRRHLRRYHGVEL